MSSAALLVSLLSFTLAAIGVSLFGLSELDEIAAGLALYVAAVVVGAARSAS